MIQFERYSIEHRISTLNTKIDGYKAVLNKIQNNEKQLVVESVERVNKVCMLPVRMDHTSEYTLELGGGYFAEVKTHTAMELLKHRMAECEKQVKRLEKILTQIQQRTKVQQKKQQESGKWVIGTDQTGEEIVEIVQFGDQPKKPSNLPKIQETEPQQQLQRLQEIKQPSPQPVKPKKMSKFKMERMQKQ